MDKEQLYTLRWSAMQIARLSEDPKVDSLAMYQIEILSQLLGEPVPEEFKTPEPARPSVIPVTEPKKPVLSPLPQADKKLWYPKAVIRQDLKKSAKGQYPMKYPYGAVVHFTAGHYTRGVQNAISSIESSPYFFCCLGTDGQLVQANPFNQWGYHAGKSAWIINGKKQSGVSNLLVGIEINNPGRLDKVNGKYYTWYDKARKNPLDPKSVRVIDKDDANIQAGYYLPYTKEQESALVELFLWMKANNPDVFNFDYVLGHDEVAPKRKSDPGGALSMTMPKFRQLLKDEYAKRA